MSNELTRQDPAYGRLLAANRSHTTELVRFPMKLARETGLAPTYVIAKYDGGVGSSTLAAILGMFMNNPLFIEIGGNKSRAFKAIDEADIVRFPSSDPDRFQRGFDARLQQASRPAIIELEQSLYRDAIQATVALRTEPFYSSAILIFVASKNDEKLAFRKLSDDCGVHDLIIFGEHEIRSEKRADVIRIPTLPKEIQDAFYVEGLSFMEAVQSCPALFTRKIFIGRLQQFHQQVIERLEK